MQELAHHGTSADLPRRLLLYAAALTAFLLIPPTLKPTVGPPRGFTLQELADLFTPLVVVPLAWWVIAASRRLQGTLLAVLLVVSAVWIEAQGLHLGANAIGDVFDAGSPRDAFYATDAGALDHFLDEDLSHWAWHAAWVALTTIMIWTAWRAPWPALPPQGSNTASTPAPAAGSVPASTSIATILGGLLHGVTFFLVTAEGGTAGLGIPASIAFVAASAVGLRRGHRHPVLVFVLVASVLTLLLDVVWALLHGGQLVEPCSVLGC